MSLFPKSLPARLVLCILAGILCSYCFETNLIRFFFTLSLFIKEILFFALPLVVFSYLATSLLNFNKGAAPILVFGIFLCATLSNFTSTMISYGAGRLVLPNILSANPFFAEKGAQSLSPLWDLHIPCLVPADKAMLAGLVVGLFFNYFTFHRVPELLLKLRSGVTVGLQNVFIPFLLPFYIFGYVLKMHFEGVFADLITNYVQVVALTALLILLHGGFLYWFGSRFSVARMLSNLKNMLPAGITGFSTMSSAITMPLTLEATEKNLPDPAFAHLAIPSTVNIHLLGDSLGVPLLGFAVLLFWGKPFPEFLPYLGFVMFFCLAKFSTAAVPGGGIFVLLPVLKEYLHLDDNMIAFAQVLYLLQDPLFTCANVMGNGAFAVILHRIASGLRLVPREKGVAQESP